MLISIPAAPVGPGGVIVLCKDKLIQKNLKTQIETTVNYPKRVGIDDERGSMIISYGALTHKTKDRYDHFFLIQNEQGDLFKVIF